MSFDISELESKPKPNPNPNPSSVDLARLVAAYVSQEIHSDKRKPIAPEWITPAQAAIYLQTTECSLRGYRARHEGPKFARRGNNVRYKISDLDAFQDKHRVIG